MAVLELAHVVCFVELWKLLCFSLAHVVFCGDRIIGIVVVLLEEKNCVVLVRSFQLRSNPDKKKEKKKEKKKRK